ncbi:hypothetical protein KCH_46940 [Kitasatospora cheerisanensis KCTC 2395]|uniref:Uncharacterized protein n=1 Tax=Kitasatospora cheerisanensis KCTC 2395 TaxID=1348663 RepID=A0A066YPT4_9ACTN|nr:hypothetical protein KCH_46940 [Kitasatospora cheerisanensis KCTC 2395]
MPSPPARWQGRDDGGARGPDTTERSGPPSCPRRPRESESRYRPRCRLLRLSCRAHHNARAVLTR